MLILAASYSDFPFGGCCYCSGRWCCFAHTARKKCTRPRRYLCASHHASLFAARKLAGPVTISSFLGRSESFSSAPRKTSLHNSFASTFALAHVPPASNPERRTQHTSGFFRSVPLHTATLLAAAAADVADLISRMYSSIRRTHIRLLVERVES